jgi:hypothetical protein
LAARRPLSGPGSGRWRTRLPVAPPGVGECPWVAKYVHSYPSSCPPQGRPRNARSLAGGVAHGRPLRAAASVRRRRAARGTQSSRLPPTHHGGTRAATPRRSAAAVAHAIAPEAAGVVHARFWRGTGNMGGRPPHRPPYALGGTGGRHTFGVFEEAPGSNHMLRRLAGRDCVAPCAATGGARVACRARGCTQPASSPLRTPGRTPGFWPHVPATTRIPRPSCCWLAPSPRAQRTKSLVMATKTLRGTCRIPGCAFSGASTPWPHTQGARQL